MEISEELRVKLCRCYRPCDEMAKANLNKPNGINKVIIVKWLCNVAHECVIIKGTSGAIFRSFNSSHLMNFPDEPRRSDFLIIARNICSQVPNFQ